jgi:Major Facilitator Superfamily
MSTMTEALRNGVDAAQLDRVVLRNTLLLAATTAVNSAVLQLVAAVSSLTFALVTGVTGLLGLGPAIFLCASGMTAVVAGRAMDRVGRRPVIAAGFVASSSGCALNALACATGAVVPLVFGLVLIGSGQATYLLVRTAAGDMYRPERRARWISYVLFGSVFGAILGPTACFWDAPPTRAPDAYGLRGGRRPSRCHRSARALRGRGGARLNNACSCDLPSVGCGGVMLRRVRPARRAPAGSRR